MSDTERTSIEQAARVSHFVHLSMGYLVEIIMPITIGMLAGSAVSFVDGGDAVPAWVISITSVATTVFIMGITHRLVCTVIRSSAPCALGTTGRALFPFRIHKRGRAS